MSPAPSCWLIGFALQPSSWGCEGCGEPKPLGVKADKKIGATSMGTPWANEALGLGFEYLEQRRLEG